MAVSNTVARPTKKKNYNNMAYVFVLPFVVVFLIFQRVSCISDIAAFLCKLQRIWGC